MIGGENGTGRIFSLALMERYGDKKSEGMACADGLACLRLRGRNSELNQGAEIVKATESDISLNLQSKRQW